jgi:glycerol-3-phosphate O-acyltransferase
MAFQGFVPGLDTAVLIASYIAVAAIAITAYETIRSIVKRILNRRLEKNLREFFESPDLYRQRFKFTNKLVIKHQLLSDPELNQMILQHARESGEGVQKIRRRVEGYIEEIVPSFNLFTYYRVGYPLAKMVAGSLYDSVVDQDRRQVLEELDEESAPVFVMNHRSNFDYVLLAYVLAGKVSISYAVGEWARVFPVEQLFKAFGSYFVRRGYKEPIYHKVLERYVQLIAHNGVTQAVFPEGGLTRDGLLRPAKLGLITWLARLEDDPAFKRDLVFVPIGVNYDRVLEDLNLVKEAHGIQPRTGFWKKFGFTLIWPFQVLVILITNGARYLAGQRKLHGHASISFGEPIHFENWMKQHGHDWATAGRDDRRRLIEEFGNDLMQHIGSAVPATPVTLLAVTLLDQPERRWSFDELVEATTKTRKELEEKQVRIVTGTAFARFRSSLVEHETADIRPRTRMPELEEATDAFTQQEESEEYVRFALRLLRRYTMVRRRSGKWEIRKKREDRLRFYANSLAHHLGRDWPIQDPNVASPAGKSTPAEPPPDKATT